MLWSFNSQLRRHIHIFFNHRKPIKRNLRSSNIDLLRIRIIIRLLCDHRVYILKLLNIQLFIFENTNSTLLSNSVSTLSPTHSALIMGRLMNIDWHLSQFFRLDWGIPLVLQDSIFIQVLSEISQFLSRWHRSWNHLVLLSFFKPWKNVNCLHQQRARIK